MGGSSGAALMAVDQVKDEILPGSNCVVIFPDRGERYLDTIFNDDWLESHWPGRVLKLYSDGVSPDQDGCEGIARTTGLDRLTEMAVT